MRGIFRPFRGKRSTAISKDIILKKGEVFFEVPDTGVGTGEGKIVMGDGQTRYEDLPYYINGSGGSGEGSVTEVKTGVGLTGGPITSEGTIKCNLQLEQKSTLEAAARGMVTNREYAVGLDKNGKLSVNVPWTDTTYETLSPDQGGTEKSIVTTGEKYTWGNKQSKDLANPITVKGAEVTTVEGTLNALADAVNSDDTWTAVATVDANSKVTFTGLSDSKAYTLYVQNKLANIEDVEVQGSGDNQTMIYTLSNVTVGDNCKLRIIN